MLWQARRIGLTDDDLDYLSDFQIIDLLKIDNWFNTPKEKSDKPREVIHHVSKAEVDKIMGR